MESPKGIFGTSVAGASLTGFKRVRLVTVTEESSFKRNCSGAKKRRTGRDRKRASQDLRLWLIWLTSNKRDSGHVGNKRRKDFNSSPSADRNTKRFRTHVSGIYTGATDPLTKVIVAENSLLRRDVERLSLPKGTVSKIDEIWKGLDSAAPIWRRMYGGGNVCGLCVVRLAGWGRWSASCQSLKIGLEALQRQHRAVVWVLDSSESATTVLKWLGK